MRNVLLSLVTLALFAAPTLAQCPNCSGPSCPSCPVVQSSSDPYVAFYSAIQIVPNATGVLFVGSPKVLSINTEGSLVCFVSSGFAGLAPGAYRCWNQNGLNVMIPLVVPTATTCDCCKPTCTCHKPIGKDLGCKCYPCKCNKGGNP